MYTKYLKYVIKYKEYPFLYKNIYKNNYKNITLLANINTFNINNKQYYNILFRDKFRYIKKK